GRFEIGDGDSEKGLAVTGLGGNVIRLDDNANGYGWFVDTTPADDSEFATAVTATELRATDGPAVGHMDLLTVVMHEMAHILGRDDLATDQVGHDLLTETLDTGVRRLPASATTVSAAQPVDSAAPLQVVSEPSDLLFADLPRGLRVDAAAAPAGP